MKRSLPPWHGQPSVAVDDMDLLDAAQRMADRTGEASYIYIDTLTITQGKDPDRPRTKPSYIVQPAEKGKRNGRSRMG